MKDLQELNITANNFVAELFKNHNVDCSIENELLVFEKELMDIELEFIKTNSSSAMIFVQLNIYINYELKPIIESFAGYGDTYEEAGFSALDNFTKNSFHTILSAFFTSEYDDEVVKEQWSIGGKVFDVTTSNVGVRGELPVNFSMDWVDKFNEELKKQTFGEGVHFARLFYGQDAGKTIANEVYIDDEIREDLQKIVCKYDFKPSDDFYTVRVFMILKNGIGLSRVSKIIANTESYEEVEDKLSVLGFSNLEIDTLYSYITEAFGQKLIQVMGVEGEFLNQATISNKHNEEFAVDLNKDSLFLKTLDLVTELTQNGWTDELKNLGAMSANFNALNNALNEGSELENFDCTCFVTCFQFPDYTAESQVGVTKQEQRKKPFWKFW